MPSRLTTSLALLAATICYAQDFEQNDSRYTLAQIWLNTPFPPSEPYQITDWYTPECGLLSAGSNSISLAIYTNYTANACYNINEIFTPDEDELVERGSGGNTTCYPSNALETCENDYSVSPDDYNPEGNYSQVWFQLLHPRDRDLPAEIPLNLEDFTMRVYAGEDCSVGDEEPSFVWGGCEDGHRLTDVGCSSLPYGVRSIRVEQTTEENRDTCRIAVEVEEGEEASAGTRKEVSLMAMVFSVFVAAGVMVV